MRPTAEELRRYPVLSTGQVDDLHMELDGLRFWVSRCTMEDGEPCDDKVSIERLTPSGWITHDVYDGNDTDRTMREKGQWL
jgi:hypothetical protein